MGEAAHGYALGGAAGGVNRVHLEVVAEGVGLIAIVVCSGCARCRDVPAGELVVGGRRGVPALASAVLGGRSDGCACNAIARVARGQLAVGSLAVLGNVPVDGPVLFATEVGAPGSLAVAAVIERAASRCAGGVELRDHELLDVVEVCLGATHIDEGAGVNAAVQRGVHLVAGGLAVAIEGELDNRDAVMVDFLHGLELGAGAQVPVTELAVFLARNAVGGLAIGVEEMRVGRALVVHSQHSTAGGGGGVLAIGADVEEVHAVVVVTNTTLPIVGLCAGVRVLGQIAVEAIARGVQHGYGIAGRNDHLVGDALAHSREAQTG